MITIDEETFKIVDFFGNRIVNGRNVLVVEFDGKLYRYVKYVGGLNYLKEI